MLIVGDKEVADSSVSVRLRSGQQLPAQPFDSFVQTVKQAIESKTREIA